MKNTYTKPEMAIIEYNTETPMLSVSTGGTLSEVENGGDGTGLDADTRGHRGSWGNLWD